MANCPRLRPRQVSLGEGRPVTRAALIPAAPVGATHDLSDSQPNRQGHWLIQEKVRRARAKIAQTRTRLNENPLQDAVTFMTYDIRSQHRKGYAAVTSGNRSPFFL